MNKDGGWGYSSVVQCLPSVCGPWDQSWALLNKQRMESYLRGKMVTPRIKPSAQQKKKEKDEDEEEGIISAFWLYGFHQLLFFFYRCPLTFGITLRHTGTKPPNPHAFSLVSKQQAASKRTVPCHHILVQRFTFCYDLSTLQLKHTMKSTHTMRPDSALTRSETVIYATHG